VLRGPPTWLGWPRGRWAESQTERLVSSTYMIMRC
jgi:hypothetical protein